MKLDPQTLYVSEPLEVGNHLWRLIIARSTTGLVTRYEFQDESKCFWCCSKKWPTYNTNDTYSGLPRGLSKLFDRERPALIQHGLIQARPNRQLSLSF